MAVRQDSAGLSIMQWNDTYYTQIVRGRQLKKPDRNWFFFRRRRMGKICKKESNGLSAPPALQRAFRPPALRRAGGLADDQISRHRYALADGKIGVVDLFPQQL